MALLVDKTKTMMIVLAGASGLRLERCFFTSVLKREEPP